MRSVTLARSISGVLLVGLGLLASGEGDEPQPSTTAPASLQGFLETYEKRIGRDTQGNLAKIFALVQGKEKEIHDDCDLSADDYAEALHRAGKKGKKKTEE